MTESFKAEVIACKYCGKESAVIACGLPWTCCADSWLKPGNSFVETGKEVNVFLNQSGYYEVQSGIAPCGSGGIRFAKM